MRFTLPGLLAALFAAALFAAPAVADDKKDEKKDDKKADKVKETEKKLLGKWKLVKSDMGEVGDEFKFFIVYKEKGEMDFVREVGDEKVVSKGKYKVTDADKVDWTVDEGGTERGEVSTVKELSDKKLIIEDPQGVKEEFEKVVEKKKDDKKEEKKEDKKDQ